MDKSVISFNNLKDFLLLALKKCPAMYLLESKISNLSIFISGYLIAKPEDPFFKEKGFINWVCNKKNIDKQQYSYWTDIFLIEAGNDEHKALLLFLNYLEEFDLASQSAPKLPQV